MSSSKDLSTSSKLEVAVFHSRAVTGKMFADGNQTFVLDGLDYFATEWW